MNYGFIKILIPFFLILILRNISYSQKLAAPEYGIYHGAFPDMGATEDSVTAERIIAFDSLTGNPAIWVYFSDNWFHGIKFPQKELEIINSTGKIPFIRMMPRSDFIEGNQDPVYTLQKIIDGNFDNEFVQYAKSAGYFGKPIMIEFGTEVNGNWFSWSGMYNGGGETDNYGNPEMADGPERFRDAYKHIINIFRKEGADNITWVFHAAAESAPEEKWNRMTEYYPGDNYIDWIGVSIYGAQEQGEKWHTFKKLITNCYNELRTVSAMKPIAILEFGVIEDPHKGNKAKWIHDALQLLIDSKFPGIKAISYWHSLWRDDNGIINNMRLDSSPESIIEYKKQINNSIFRPKVLFTSN